MVFVGTFHSEHCFRWNKLNRGNLAAIMFHAEHLDLELTEESGIGLASIIGFLLLAIGSGSYEPRFISANASARHLTLGRFARSTWNINRLPILKAHPRGHEQ